MEEALENTVILRHLFRFLSTPDLLHRCSLVSKKWNFVARSFLQDSRHCFASVTDSDPGRTLVALNQALGEFSDRPVPYNGLYFNICPDDGNAEVCRDSNFSDLSFIEDKWPLKYLRIRWDVYIGWGYKSCCPCAGFLPKLLSKKSETLEELVFEALPSPDIDYSIKRGVNVLDKLFTGDDDDDDAEYGYNYGDDDDADDDEDDDAEDDEHDDADEEKKNNETDEDEENDDKDAPFRNMVLPKLKKLQSPIWRPELFFASKFVQHLLKSGAPRLQELYCQTAPGFPSYPLIPKDKVKLLTRMELNSRSAASFTPSVLKFLALKPKLCEIYIHNNEIYGGFVNWDVVIEFLKQSSDTLEFVEFGAIPAQGITHMPVLPKVKDLHMNLRSDLIMQKQNYRDYVASFDFLRTFPLSRGLEFSLTVKLHTPSPEDESIWINQDILAGAEGGGASVIRRLNVIAASFFSYRLEALPQLMTIFPNVEIMSLRRAKGGLDPSYWAGWPKLRSMRLGLAIGEDLESWDFDSLFAGIHPDEVVELKRKDEEYLAKVHIVPIRPPLNYLRDLQTLEVFLYPYGTFSREQVARLLQLISKVSKNLVFNRLPQLKVTFIGSTEFFERDRSGFMFLPGKSIAPGLRRESASNAALSAGADCKMM